MAPSQEEKEHPAVTSFREYLRIRTVQPTPDYASSTAFLCRAVSSLGLEPRVVDLVPGKPLVLATWEGTEPELPSVLLNSHTDVVPVFPDKWKHDPFSAFKEPNGDIYGRGSQDMKCVTIQHLEAVRRLKEAGRRLRRTLHFCFIADEEIGSFDGMAKFVNSDEFREARSPDTISV